VLLGLARHCWMDQLHMTGTQSITFSNLRYYAHIHGGVLCNAVCTTNVVIYLYVLWIICMYYIWFSWCRFMYYVWLLWCLFTYIMNYLHMFSQFFPIIDFLKNSIGLYQNSSENHQDDFQIKSANYRLSRPIIQQNQPKFRIPKFFCYSIISATF
jgi:hypothetical protein